MKLIVLVYLVVAFGIVLFLWLSQADRDYALSLAVAYLLSLFHLSAGYAVIRLGFQKSNTTFLKTVLGGMAGRLFLMLTAFFVLLEVVELNTAVLVYTMLGLYVLNLTLEISFLQKEVSAKKP